MKSSVLFGISSLGYLSAMIFYISYLVTRKDVIAKIAFYISTLGFVIHTAAFIKRWYEFSSTYNLGIFQSIPITTLYESLIFFAWCVILANILIEVKYKIHFLGAFVTALAGMAIAFIDMVGVSKDIQPLVPALKSNWLLAHASLSFVAYSAFSISFVSSLLHLAYVETKKRSGIYILWTFLSALFISMNLGLIIDFILGKTKGGVYKPFSYALKNIDSTIGIIAVAVSLLLFFIIWQFGYKMKDVMDRFNVNGNFMEELTYKAISIGFPIFTIGGLIFGAVWAEKSWGRYWSWDPKETWSLITWLIYAFYLHARFVKEMRGVKVSAIAAIAFISTIFTYIGVNLFISGLHSYGSIQ